MYHIEGKGHVHVELVAENGARTLVADDHNTLLYRCADAIARLFAGQAGRPTHIGFVVGTTSTQATDFHFTGDRTSTQASIAGGALVVKDVALAPNPQLQATKDYYVGNKVMFSAMSTDNAAQEWAYGFLLKDGEGQDANVLAVMKLENPVSHPANYALSAAWGVTFN